MTNNNKKQIEIELISLFDKKKCEALKRFLDSHAVDLRDDNKDVYFFPFARQNSEGSSIRKVDT